VLAVTALGVGSARAQAPGICPPEVAEWVARASVDLDVDVEARRCDGEIVVARLSADGFAANVELRRSPAGGFRRAGPWAVSPVLEVDDYRDVPAPFRAAFDRLVAWVSANPEVQPGVVVAEAAHEYRRLPPRTPPVRVVLAMLIVLVASGLRRGLAAPRADPRMLGLAFVGALAIRALFAPWEAFRGGQGPLWIGSLYAHTPLAARPGYGELYGMLAHAGGAHVETVVFATNLVLSAATVPVGAAVVRWLGASERATLFSAIALATDPLSIRMSASESYLVPVVFLSVCGAALALAAGRRLDRGHRAHALVLAVAGALLLDQAARVHPAAWPAVASAPLVLLATATPRLARRARRALAFAGLAALPIAASLLFDMISAVREADEATGLAAPPEALYAAVALVAVAGLTPKDARRVLLYAAPSALLAVWAATAWDTVPDMRVGYLRTASLPIVVACAFAVPRFARRTRIAVVAAVACLGLNAALAWTPATELDTSARENRLIRSILDGMGPECRLLHPGPEPMLPLYHGRRLGQRPRGSSLPAERGALAASGALTCAWYYRGSFCSAPEGGRVCPLVEEGAELERKWSWRLEARPHTTTMPLGPEPVIVELFEVSRPRGFAR
jgi:hypothetical protein